MNTKDNYNVDAEHLSGPNGCAEGCEACTPQHTPTPDLKTFVIMGTPEQKDYVRRAVNAHDELLEAAKIGLSFLKQIGYHGGGNTPGAILERAIAKAEVK